MTTVLRAVGPLPAADLTAKLGASMTANSPHLQTLRQQRAEQQASRNLRQEQDSAYERSLAADRERARRRREEEEAAVRREEEALAQAVAAERLRLNRHRWKLWRSQSIEPEPPPDGGAAGVIRLSIRMPSGERVVRRFRASSDLEEVYAFVECYDILHRRHDEDDGGVAATGDHDDDEKADAGPSSGLGRRVEKPSDYEHEYKFRLVSPMPRTVYGLGEQGPGREAGPGTGHSVGQRIGRGGANLIVEPIEEDNEDDDDDDEKEEREKAERENGHLSSSSATAAAPSRSAS